MARDMVYVACEFNNDGHYNKLLSDFHLITVQIAEDNIRHDNNNGLTFCF